MVQKPTMPRGRLNWDDLRVALAVARAGSLRGAARALGVSHSTVLRRLQELEAAAGVRLFERSADAYSPTHAGQDAFDTARDLEEAVLALERRVEGLDLKLSGPIRVTLPDPLLPTLLPLLKTFGEKYPEIDLTLSLGLAYLDLAQREADLALRVAESPPPELVGRRIARVVCGVFGSERYLEGRSTKQLERLDWVGWPAADASSFSNWMRERLPKARVALRCESTWAVRDAVDAGLGVALLPCILGDTRPGWRRLRLVPEVSAPLWILTHRDLRATGRVRVLSEQLFQELSALKGVFEGTAQSRSPTPPRC